MKRESNNIDGISKTKRLPHWITTKLGGGYEVNKNSKKSYKKAIWQEEMKLTRIEDRRQCVVGSNKYPFKSTLKEAWPEKI